MGIKIPSAVVIPISFFIIVKLFSFSIASLSFKKNNHGDIRKLGGRTNSESSTS